MRRCYALGRICLSVSLWPVRALTFESFDLESLFLYTGTFSEYLGQIRISRSSGQGQGHRSKRACLRVSFAGGVPSTERQSCYCFF